VHARRFIPFRIHDELAKVGAVYRHRIEALRKELERLFSSVDTVWVTKNFGKYNGEVISL
jgi:hypothetical protein